MYCAKCGKEVMNDHAFCSYCGTPVRGSNEVVSGAKSIPDNNTNEKRNNRKANTGIRNMLRAFIFLAVIVVGIIVYRDFLLPKKHWADMEIQYLEARDYESAHKCLVEPHIFGGQDEREKVDLFVEEDMASFVNKYNTGEITSEEIREVVDNYTGVFGGSFDRESWLGQINVLESSKLWYQNGNEACDQGNYESAIMSYMRVISEDANFEDAYTKSVDFLTQLYDEWNSDIDNAENKIDLESKKIHINSSLTPLRAEMRTVIEERQHKEYYDQRITVADALKEDGVLAVNSEREKALWNHMEERWRQLSSN